MKGKLYKTEQGWVVRCLKEGSMTWHKGIPLGLQFEKVELPLHPQHANIHKEYLQIGEEVEFEIVDGIFECKGLSDEGCFMDSPAHNCGCQQKYAKLINVDKLGNNVKGGESETFKNDVEKLDYNADMTPAEQLKSIANKLENKVMPTNHICRYSKKMSQPYPRLCIDCGKPEQYTFTVKDDVREVVEDDVEKLAEQEFPYQDDTNVRTPQNNHTDILRWGFTKGYNKAKEILLSEKRDIEYLKRESYRKGFLDAKENTYTEEQVMEAIDMARKQKLNYLGDKWIIIHPDDEIIQSIKQPK